MRTLLRISIILVACLVVTGVTYAIGQTDWANQATPRFERSGAEGVPTQAQASEPNSTGGERGGRAADLSVRGWLGFGQMLIPMTIITALISFLTTIRKRRSRLAKTSNVSSTVAEVISESP